MGRLFLLLHPLRDLHYWWDLEERLVVFLMEGMELEETGITIHLLIMMLVTGLVPSYRFGHQTFYLSPSRDSPDQ